MIDISDLFRNDHLITSCSTMHLNAELVQSTNEAIHIHRRNTRMHVAHRLATDEQFTKTSATELAGQTLVTITTKAVVMTPEAYEEAIRRAYERGLMRGSGGPYYPRN